MFVHDKGLSQGHHEQGTQQAADDGEDEDREVVEVVGTVGSRKKKETRKREGHTGGDAFTGAARGLYDVVLQDGGLKETAPQRDGDHRDGD